MAGENEKGRQQFAVGLSNRSSLMFQFSVI
jgi:hypothetical protein